MLLLFLTGCIFFRSNFGYHQHKDQPELHISQTIRYLHVIGPTSKIHLSPELEQLSLGLEISPSFLFVGLKPIDEIENRPLRYMYLLSGIGVHFVEYQRRFQRHEFGVMSPFVQIHSPPLCSIPNEKRMFCISAYGEYEYHIMLKSENYSTWNAGLSIHYGIGFFRF